ncbi:MAG: HD domain-containing protein [Nitrospirae bacterium]|nr:HD domain-containing protein [Nitrospirota bacterium]
MKHFHFKSITNRNIAFGLSISLLTFIFALLIFSSSIEHIKSEIHDHNQYVAENAAQSVDVFFKTIEENLYTAAASYEIGSILEKRRGDLLPYLIKLPSYIKEITVLDRGGVEISRASRERFVSRLEANKKRASLPLKVLVKENIHFSKIHNTDFGEPLKGFWHSITGIHLGEKGYIFVVDENGKVIAHPDWSVVIKDANFKTSPQVVRFINKWEGNNTSPYKNENGMEVIGTYAVSKRNGWGIIAEQPAIEAYAQFYNLKSRLLALIAISLFFAVFLSIYIGWRLTSPLKELKKKAEEFGRGYLSSKISINRDDEIGELAHTFNNMADSILDKTNQLKLANRNLQEMFNCTIKSLATVLDGKSPWTAGHSERVTNYALSIASYFDNSAEFLENVRICSLLHDIGKICISDAILEKVDIFTDDDIKIMREHPIHGAKILSSIRQFENIIPAIRHHHEYFNGCGYPDGLSGETIPLIARILSVVDAYDAMTTDRHYRKAMDMSAALEELKSNAGVQFDPQVVEVFLQILLKNQEFLSPIRKAAIVNYR